MPEYSCLLIQTMRFKDGEFTVRRPVRLPFVPFIGLVLTFDENDYSTEIEHIEYIVADREFWCSSFFEINCVPCSCGPEDGCCVVGDTLADYLEKGWELEGKVRMLKDHPDLARRIRKPWQFTLEQLGIEELEPSS